MSVPPDPVFPSPTEPAGPAKAGAAPGSPPDHLPRWMLVGVGAVAGLLAASLAALGVAWLPLAGWSGPLAAAIVAAVAVPLAWRLGVQLGGRDRGQAGFDDSEPGLTDAESGLLRRKPFLIMASREWARAGRYGGQVGMLVVEIDRLRAMTDQAGPAVADTLLAGLGRDIMKSLRGADLATRYGDAQLACFLPEADPTGALDVADRIRERVEQLTMPGLPPATQLTASIGVAVLRPGGQPLSTLQSDAETALAQARQAGGNCVRMPLHDRRRTTSNDQTERRKGS